MLYRASRPLIVTAHYWPGTPERLVYRIRAKNGTSNVAAERKGGISDHPVRERRRAARYRSRRPASPTRAGLPAAPPEAAGGGSGGAAGGARTMASRRARRYISPSRPKLCNSPKQVIRRFGPAARARGG